MWWKKTRSYTRFLMDCQHGNRTSTDWDTLTSGGFYVECGMNIRPWACSLTEAWTAWHHFLFVICTAFLKAPCRSCSSQRPKTASLLFLLLRTFLLRFEVRFYHVSLSVWGCFHVLVRTWHFLLRWLHFLCRKFPLPLPFGGGTVV